VTPHCLSYLLTKKTPERIQTTSKFHLFCNPEKFLKSRRYFRQTVSSTNKKISPKFTQYNLEYHEGESSIPPLYEKYPIDKVTPPESNLVLLVFETEAFSASSHTDRKWRATSLLVATHSPSLLEVRFPTSQNSKNYPIYLDSTSVDSLVFSPCGSEGTNPHSPSSSFSSFFPFDNQFLETRPYNPQTLTINSTMDAAGGGGAGGAVAGGQGGGAGG
jgi:hypothetical protein